MTFTALIRASLLHYRGVHAMVVGGVAVAVAVLAGALLVGTSVRASLRDLALARLGATEIVVSSAAFFRDQLDRAVSAPEIAATSPLLAVHGAVTAEESDRTAARVQVFGIDQRFIAFHGLGGPEPSGREAWMSPGLAAELGVSTGDAIILRVAKPTDLPLSTLQGRRDEVSERVRLTVARVLDRASLGEFSLLPAQGPSLSLFVPLARLQQDLEVGASANALLVRMTRPADAPDADVATVKRAVAAGARLADLGLTTRVDASKTATILESRTGLLTDAVWQPAADAASKVGRSSVTALTYLANTIRANGREIPYSLITAMDLASYDRVRSGGPAATSGMSAAPDRQSPAQPPIHLNEWAVDDLGVRPGDQVEVDYFLWSDEAGLQTRTAAFTFAGTVPMTGAGGDATLTPEYPGITDASSVMSWDPPFPVELGRVRDKDEAYWDRWRSAPKAFIPLSVGEDLWPSPFGTISSIRVAGVDADWPPFTAFDPFASALTARHARADALAAADGTTDFGEYFVYFSFFIVVSGLLLAGLFFALAVEQRARELGLLAAVGFGAASLRRLLLGEAAVLILAGSALGILGAVGYAALIMFGLRTWWVGAVGTTLLTLHVDPLLMLAGAAGAAGAALVALMLSFRRLSQRSTRSLLTTGLASDPSVETHPADDEDDLVARPVSASRTAAVVAAASAAAAAALVVLGATRSLPPVAGFFGAGGLLLIAGCAAFGWWLRRSSGAHSGVAAFGAAYARRRPTRSVLSAALIAFACFVIVAVAAFRKDGAEASLARESGTGGFALMAESVAPLMHNPNTPEGRDELSLGGYEELDGLRVARFRLRPGDEASCLTLYQPKNPRIVAPEAAFLGERRFTFADTIEASPTERQNPWLLLEREFDDGAIPAIADQTSLTYVFHLRVGDDFVFTPQGSDPVRLRIVATLADSVLQSELIIGEASFVRLFPTLEGYRVWLIEASAERVEAVTTRLEDRLSDFGVDVVDTRVRLAAYHQVENTYLSTFQALGALGLLLGTVGLAAVLARNVLERRRELGLLGAVGFTPRHLRTMVTAESTVLVATGLIVGTISALVAIVPAILERAGSLPLGSLGGLLAAVVVTATAASAAAVRVATSVSVVEALKSE